jgi:3-keto-5-aminohexanoate cleavage enzyme
VSGPAILRCALTGPIATKSDNPHLPTTPEEIAQAAREAHAAGAAVVHVHLRDEQQRPTADLEIARRTVGLIRESCDALVQLSTGVGLEVPFAERERLIETEPVMATLNPCSMSFGNGEFRNPPDGVRRLAARMQELGIRPELEIYDTGHLVVCLQLAEEGLVAAPLQFSIVMGVRGGMPTTATALVELVGRLPRDCVWQAIAIGRANLPITAVALAMGGNARTGMEDTLLLRRGVLARSNVELVTRLVGVATTLEREPATVTDVAAKLGLRGSPSPVG